LLRGYVAAASSRLTRHQERSRRALVKVENSVAVVWQWQPDLTTLTAMTTGTVTIGPTKRRPIR